MRRFRAILFVVTFFAAWDLDDPAFAYLDPGTGSIILQVLLGGAVGVLVIAKLYWRRIKSIFSRKSTNEGAELKTDHRK